MCYYADHPYKLHWACTDCRVSFKRHPPAPDTTHRCPDCGGPLRCAGHDFSPPRRRDTRAWSVVAAVLDAGLRYEGRELCGCGREPKYRPGDRSALRVRTRLAERTGLPLAEMLARPDPDRPADDAGASTSPRAG